MAIYKVLLPVGAADRTSAAERAIFLREGFSWPAFLFGPLWLLGRGLWRPLLIWCVAALIAGFAISYGRLPEPAGTWLYLLSAILLGLEGQNFRAAAMARSGFDVADIAAGADRLVAERGFFARWLADAGSPPPAVRPNTPIAPAHVIGLFPESGNLR